MNKFSKKLWLRAFSFLLIYFVFTSLLQANSLSEKRYLTTPNLRADYVVNQVQLEWSKNESEGFKFYHVLRSEINPVPSYPEMEPIFSTNDREKNIFSETVDIKPGVHYYYRVCSVNTKNNVSCSAIAQLYPSGFMVTYDFFDDVERDSWYEPYVKNLLKKEVIYVGSQHSFDPEVPVNRGELARWVVRALIERGGFDLSVKPAPFCDVDYSHPEMLYVSHAYELGLVEGVESKNCLGRIFEPDRPVSRAEALKMILLAFDYSPDQNVIRDDSYNYANKDLFVDVHQSHWAAPYIGRAKDENIISGYPDNTFRPDQSVNHAEMAKMLSIAFRFDDSSNQ